MITTIILDISEIKTLAKYAGHRNPIPKLEVDAYVSEQIVKMFENGYDIYTSPNAFFPAHVQGMKKGLMDPENKYAL